MHGDRLDQLLPQVRAGDEAAYRQFLTKAADRLRVELRRQLASEETLEEVVRDCLVALHRKRHTLDSGRAVARWLNAIAHSRLAEHKRRHPDPALSREPERRSTKPIGFAALQGDRWRQRLGMGGPR